tara:strand:+ start:139 stop:570 length:432 start_codon:yes stop_codon:yes gene_type:complete
VEDRLKQRTLAIIKPDAVGRNIIGEIICMAQERELVPVAAKLIRLSRERAQNFYSIHRDKEFFDSLTEYMCEGPIFVMILEGEESIEGWREVMGATDPAKANDGTIRKRFGENIERNSVHGSDGPETARVEIDFFSKDLELRG